MDKKGAIICFQKFNLSILSGEIAEDHFCLGYFGRMDVVGIDSFKDYIREASCRKAELQCSRKQILLYQIKPEYDNRIIIKNESAAGAGTGGIPLCAVFEGKEIACSLCCCTVLNLSSKVDTKDVAEKLFEAFEKSGIKDDLYYGIFGVLGEEDLCVVLLSNSYEKISNGIDIIQTLKVTQEEYAVDNTHSILTVGLNDEGSTIDWGQNTKASVHFSLKSISGIEYINTIVTELNRDSKYEGRVISTRETGGYDVVLECPAACLTEEAFRKLTSYTNKEYCDAVYQSETILYPFGELSSVNRESTDKSKTESSDENDRVNKLMGFIEGAVKILHKNLLDEDEYEYEDSRLIYIKSTLYRLLKDYLKVYTYPYSEAIIGDLEIQFKVAINAIVLASNRVKYNYMSSRFEESISRFMKDFEHIINEYDDSLQAICQLDRLNFNEQSSYILNIGSYNKILRSYYGMVKEMLEILYSVKRVANSKQDMLIPIIHFGQVPIIRSYHYQSFYVDNSGKKVDALLVCITLPYQALANPPKYLGILVHEIFHYSAPADREQRNMIVFECCLNIVICEFIGALASVVSDGRIEGGYATRFRNEYAELIEAICQKTTVDTFRKYSYICTQRSFELKETVFRMFKFLNDPRSENYAFYFDCWRSLRRLLLSNENNNVDDDAEIDYIFALKEDINDDSKLKEAFSLRVKDVVDFNNIDLVLGAYLKAVIEVAPDIAELNVVMHDSENNWARQYFWQITAIKGDLQFERNLKDVAPSDTIEYINAEKMDSNILRIGMVLSYCMCYSNGKVETPKDLESLVREWCKGENSKDRFLIAQEEFKYWYLRYTECFGPLMNKFGSICDLKNSALHSLKEGPKCLKIMEKFTEYYKRYYTAIDKYKDTDKDEFKAEHFKLCLDIIEYYQNQISFIDLCNENTSNISSEAVLTQDKHMSYWNKVKKSYNYTINHPADFAKAINNAQYIMSVGDMSIEFWYRGNRKITRSSIPNIMRDNDEKNGFLDALYEEIQIARSQILPVGQEFCQAEWLSFLQHNEFKTNILDFSEEFYTALFFAIEKWIDKSEEPSEENACVEILNPVLFNLAMDALDCRDICQSSDETKTAMLNLDSYLKNGKRADGRRAVLPLFAEGEDVAQYKTYFDYNDNIRPYITCRPRAALVPKNSERMKKQSGQFVFFDLHTRPEKIGERYSYEKWSLDNLQDEYIRLVYSNSSEEFRDRFKPFLYKMEINSFFYIEFIRYVQAIGLCKHRVYPEFDKLAKDVLMRLGIK